MPCASPTGRLLACAMFAAVLFLATVPAQADPALPQLWEQQRERRELERQQRLRRLSRPEVSPPAAPASPDIQSDHCWPISGLRLAGNTLIDRDTLNASLDPLLQPCMGEAQINEVLKAITRLYMQEGYLASRPYLANPPQGGATLDIMIVEGFVESVEFEDPDLPLSLERAFPDLLGQPLTLRALEQGLNQMNRLRSVDLGADVMPGSLQGGTRVVVRSKRPQTSRMQWYSDLNNFGHYTTGRGQAALALNIDSPLQQNDTLQLRSMSNLPGGPGQIRGLGLGYSIPHGPWLLSLSADQVRYRAPLPLFHLVSHGDIDVYSVQLERALWHRQTMGLSASVQLSQKRVNNRLSGHKIGLQSPNLAVLGADLNLSWRNQSLWNATLGYSQGLDLLGADTQTFNPRSPEPRFRKYRASLWQGYESLAPLRWQWTSELTLQYSPDPLHALEQIAVGDGLGVRGFRDSAVSGSSGATWRNTLSLPLNTSLPLEVRPTIGLDAGWSRIDHGAPSQRLLGASVGLHLIRPDARLRLDYQHALHNDETPGHALEKGHWRAQLTLLF